MYCAECDRIRRYMNADPELYRVEERTCMAHRKVQVDSEYVKPAEQLVQEYPWLKRKLGNDYQD